MFQFNTCNSMFQQWEYMKKMILFQQRNKEKSPALFTWNGKIKVLYSMEQLWYIFFSICAKFAQQKRQWFEKKNRKEKWMNIFRHLIVEINGNRLIAFNKLPTFGKIYMGCFIVRPIRMFEIAHQGANRILRGWNEVNRFHGCQWLPPFVQIFYHYWIDFR